MPRLAPPAAALLSCMIALPVPDRPACAATGDPAAETLLAEMRVVAGGDRWSTVHGLRIVATAASGSTTGRSERWQDVATGRYLTRTDWPARPEDHVKLIDNGSIESSSRRIVQLF